MSRGGGPSDALGAGAAGLRGCFLRAPVLACRAPFWTALSICETRPRCSLFDRLGLSAGDGALEPPEFVFTALVRRRFSTRSRSVRRIRFFCDAMLAIGGGVL